MFLKTLGRCVKNYQLDPAHYYTAAGLAWDVSLEMTGAKLELLIDPGTLLMFEKGICEGASMISEKIWKSQQSLPEQISSISTTKVSSLPRCKRSLQFDNVKNTPNRWFQMDDS